MHMDALQWFGLASLSAGLVFYSLEPRYSWAVLGFAGACVCGSIYGFLLNDAWPFGLVEAIWAVVALRKWMTRGASR